MIWNANGVDEIVINGSRSRGRLRPHERTRDLDGRRVAEWVTPTPVAAHGLLYVASNGPGGNIIMAIRPGGRGDVTNTHVAWRYERAAPYSSSPVVVGDYLFTVKNGGVMTCLNATTGMLVWQQRLPAAGDYYASLLAARAEVYALSEDGDATGSSPPRAPRADRRATPRRADDGEPGGFAGTDVHPHRHASLGNRPPGGLARRTMTFDFQPRTRLVFGAGASSQLGALARELGFRRTLVVADKGLVSTGQVARAVASLEAAGVSAGVFDGFDSNPDSDMVEIGRAHAAKLGIDSLVAWGGGSSLDCAKGINFLLTNGGSMADYRGYGKASEPMLPMIAVPTTAGTGSEVQTYA